MKLQALKNAMCFRRRESFVQGSGCMRRKIVHHHADPLRARIMNIGQIAHAEGEVARGSMFGDFHMAPRPVRIEKHEQIGRAIAPIFAIVSLGLTWRGRDRFTYLSDQLCRAFVEASHRTPGIGLFSIEVEHILRTGDISYCATIWMRKSDNLDENL
jgi:hypothetical protein